LIPIDRPPYSEISVRLQGMQVCTKAKKGSIQDLQSAIPDLQEVAKRITDIVVGLKGKQDDIKKNLTTGYEIATKTLDYLDLSWEFEVADCELVLQDSNWEPGKKPFGVVRVSTFNRQQLGHRFKELETELIDTKMILAQSEADTDNLKQTIQDLKEEINKHKKLFENETKKYTRDLEVLEQSLITTKLSLAETQSQNDQLRRQIKK